MQSLWHPGPRLDDNSLPPPRPVRFDRRFVCAEDIDGAMARRPIETGERGDDRGNTPQAQSVPRAAHCSTPGVLHAAVLSTQRLGSRTYMNRDTSLPPLQAPVNLGSKWEVDTISQLLGMAATQGELDFARVANRFNELLFADQARNTETALIAMPKSADHIAAYVAELDRRRLEAKERAANPHPDFDISMVSREHRQPLLGGGPSAPFHVNLPASTTSVPSQKLAISREVAPLDPASVSLGHSLHPLKHLPSGKTAKLCKHCGLPLTFLHGNVKGAACPHASKSADERAVLKATMYQQYPDRFEVSGRILDHRCLAFLI